MTSSFLDGAAILGALEALNSRNPTRASPWALQSAIEVTTALLLLPEIQLSPIPELHNTATGPYGVALAELSSLVDQTPADDVTRRQALLTTQKWARENRARLREALDGLHVNPSYEAWITWITRNQWPDHVRRHGGLYELTFASPIAAVLGVTRQELEKLRDSTTTQVDLQRLTSRMDSDDARLLSDAFTLSTLLRGRYYETLSRKTGTHVLHHPIREPVLMRLPSDRRTALPLSNTAWYMSTMLFSCAYHERPRDRAQSWASSVRAARLRIQSGEIDVGDKGNDEIALTVASRGARRLDLRTHPAWIDRTLDALTAVGVGTLVQFELTGFVSVGAGAAAELFLERTGILHRATKKVSNTEGRLERIGRLRAGRISTSCETRRSRARTPNRKTPRRTRSDLASAQPDLRDPGRSRLCTTRRSSSARTQGPRSAASRGREQPAPNR